MNNFYSDNFSLSRRRFVTGATSAIGLAGLGLNPLELVASSKAVNKIPELFGTNFDLNIGNRDANFTGKSRIANAVNGSIPAPTLRFKQGQTVKLNVKNNLADDSSIHWHGLILPNKMDGVPGLTFAGIKPGDTYNYEFKIKQSGTYWYHSHSGFQEQKGVYGAIIIDPDHPEPFSYDREYVIVLSDWTDEDPNRVYRKLKKVSHYYNTRERTVSDIWRDFKSKGLSGTFNDRQMWNQMRMSDNDLSDVTGMTYTFLMNGETPQTNWTGLFNRGEKIRLRFINACAMSIMDIRIPGLDMRVIAADGQYVEPVTVDEFRINIAETYDVIVEPSADQAYTIFSQTIDRSGFARGTLTPDLALNAPVPSMDERVTLTHGDMGMGGHGAHTRHNMSATNQDKSQMDHSKMNHDMSKMDHSKMDHSKMNHGTDAAMMQEAKFSLAGMGSQSPIAHAPTEYGPQVDMLAEAPMSGISDPGVGLRNNGRRVLTYADLFNLYDTPDPRDPSREIQLHLTGNMARYMWSFNGVKFDDAQPIKLKYGERVRFTLVNDTMMTHPIHLHGVWSDLETGDAKRIPRKHTITVQPGSKVSYLVTADAYGNWAYHCHLLMHMMAGMFRNVQIV